MTSVEKAIWTTLLSTSPVFTTREVAEAAGVLPSNASRSLARLKEMGALVRVRRGLWAIPTHPDLSPYAVVPHLFSTDEAGAVSLSQTRSRSPGWTIGSPESNSFPSRSRSASGGWT